MGFCRVVHRWTTLQNPMITAEGQGAGRRAGGEGKVADMVGWWARSWMRTA